MLGVSASLNDPVLLVGSHNAMAMSRLHQGELVASRQHFDEVIKLYDVAQHRRYLQLFRFDPAIHAAAQLTRLLWLLGFPDQACRKAEESLALARGLSSPLSLAFIQLFAGQLYLNLHQPEKTKEHEQACIAICDEHAIQLERAWAECWYGWAVAELGDTDEGLSHARSALDTQLSIGARVARGYSQAVRAETLWHAGYTEEAFGASRMVSLHHSRMESRFMRLSFGGSRVSYSRRMTKRKMPSVVFTRRSKLRGSRRPDRSSCAPR
jgi:hypothetical protein